MEREQKWMRATALGLATAIALAITMGLPAAMQSGATRAVVVETKPLPADVTHVAIQPASIHVIALRDRSTSGRWLSLAGHKRAG